MPPSLTSLFLLVVSLNSFAATPALEIPRRATKDFVGEAILKGGEKQLANLEAIRVAGHPTFERWVFDFSDASTRTVGKLAPEFRLHFQPSEVSNNLAETHTKQGKFQIVFRKVQKNFITLDMAKKIAAKSQYIDNVLLYPLLDDGDCGIELILKSGVAVQFQAHQPQSPAGKLVVDIKPLS